MSEIYDWLKTNYGDEYSEKILKGFEKKLNKYDDLKSEFLHYVRTGENPSKVKVEGYGVNDILNLNNSFHVIGAYNFLIWLKDDPKTALEIIKKGFPTK